METPNSYASLLDDAIAAIQRLKSAISNMSDEDRVMTCSEAAFRLNKSNNTISRYIEQGKLHKVSANGVIGVLASEVYGLMLKESTTP